MSNRVFGDADFIDASRDFVCVRIDTYESKENEKIVRDLMRGKLVNTTFCLFDPDGGELLSGIGRGVYGPFASAAGLDRVSRRFEVKGEKSEAIVPDFHSLRSAVNVASADGRPLVVVFAPSEEMNQAEENFRAIAWHHDIVGRFHFDLESNEEAIRDKLESKDSLQSFGIYVVSPDTFGLKAEVLIRIELGESPEKMRESLLAALQKYTANAQRKTYESHVAEGKRRGLYLEMPIEYGEDRDADGEIDPDHAARFRRLRENAKRYGALIPVE